MSDIPLRSSKVRTVSRYVAVCAVTLLVALCGYLLIQNGNQSEQLARRTPTLDYLVCHDQASDAVKIAQVEWIDRLSTLIALTDEASPEAVITAVTAAQDANRELQAAAQRLSNATDLSLPAQADAEPGEPYRCPTAPVGD